MLETPRDRPLPAGWAQRAGQSEMGVNREKQEAARVRRGQGTTEEGAEGGYTAWGSSRPPALSARAVQGFAVAQSRAGTGQPQRWHPPRP